MGTSRVRGSPHAPTTATPTAPIAQEFADDNDLFINEFMAAYIKMLTKGYDVCDLGVVPSMGEGATVENAYGIMTAPDVLLFPHSIFVLRDVFTSLLELQRMKRMKRTTSLLPLTMAPWLPVETQSQTAIWQHQQTPA